MDKLRFKPCPFCGSEEIHRVASMQISGFYITCENCGARTASAIYRKRKHKTDPVGCHYFDDFDKARDFVAELWNMRSNDG